MARPSLLLVDSDVRSSRVLEVSLKKAGFTIETARGAADAVEAVLRNPPDLVITDTTLPDGDGFELCQRIHREPRAAKTSVVFLSADATSEAKVRSINVGADDFLTKPVLVGEIVGRVRSLLERRDADAIARRDRPGNLSGSLAHMGVVDLLQLMESGAKSGIVHLASDPVRSGGFVARGEQRGTIYFRDGQVIDAHLDRLTDVNAVYRMLMWEDGVFEIEFKPLAREDVVRTTTQAILLEGMRRVDEWSRATEVLPPLGTRLALDLAGLGARYREVPPNVQAIVHLFDGRRTIFEVVEEAARDDLEVMSAIVELHRGGLLRPSDRPPSVMPSPEATVEAWLSGPSPMGQTVPIGIPSVLARAMIPAPNASEILSAVDPATLHDAELLDATVHDATQPNLEGRTDGTAEAPIPLTTPVERTPIPEPIADDSVVLSRHTVPANRAVLLTTPSRPPSPEVSPSLPNEPIPLTQRSAPRLSLQRVNSRAPSVIVAADSVSSALSADPSQPTADAWVPPAQKQLAQPSGMPPDNDPTETDFSTMQIRTVSPETRAAAAVLAGTSHIASTVPAAQIAQPAAQRQAPSRTPSTVQPSIPGAKTGANHTIPIVLPTGSSLPTMPPGTSPASSLDATMPGTPISLSAAPRDGQAVRAASTTPKSLAADETERVIRSRPPVAGERTPVRGPSLVVVAPEPARKEEPKPAPVESDKEKTIELPPPARARPAEDQTLVLAQKVSEKSAAAMKALTPAEEELKDEFFEKTPSDEEVVWEGSKGRWRGFAMMAALAVVAVAAVAVPRMVTQRTERAPEKKSAKVTEVKAPVTKTATTVAAEAAKPADPAAQRPVEATKPAEVARAAEVAKPTEIAKPAEVAKPEATKQAELAKPTEAGAQRPAGATKAADVKKPAEAAQALAMVQKPADTAKDAKPVDPVAQNLQQAETFLKGDKLRDAETKFRAVIGTQPNNAAAHSGLAMALYGLEKDGPAGAEAKKALALDPNAARAHLVVGLIASNRQDIAGAKKAYRRYLELEPKGDYADEVRRFMKAQQ